MIESKSLVKRMGEQPSCGVWRYRIFMILIDCSEQKLHTTVKLGNKERFDKEQIGIKELTNPFIP